MYSPEIYTLLLNRYEKIFTYMVNDDNDYDDYYDDDGYLNSIYEIIYIYIFL